MLLLTACTLNSQNDPTPPQQTPAPTSEPAPQPTPAPAPEPTPEPTPGPIDFDVPEGVLISYLNYSIYKISDDPLFKADGNVNADVLKKLMDVLNDPVLNPLMKEPKSTWASGMDYTGTSYYEATAEDFSNFVIPVPTDISKSGAVVIKLFETVPGLAGVHNMHLTEFTSQWWQLVYRATDDGNDVLTLWMMQPYRITPFNGTRYDNWTGNINDRFVDRIRSQGDNAWSGIQRNNINTVLSDERISLGLPPNNNYFFEGNYSMSISRDNLIRDTRKIIDHFNISAYVVAPDSLPGLWQSSAYQTGSNMDHYFYFSGQFYSNDDGWEAIEQVHEGFGLGATGFIWDDIRYFGINNGMDGRSVGPFNDNWPNTSLRSTYNDLFWLPSDFEVLSMGYDKEVTRSITVLADSENRATDLWATRESDTGRSGLWSLNGFDRAFDIDGLGLPRGWMTQMIWLRSQDSLAIGNINMILNTGTRSTYGVHQLAGMRPAVHLSITQLLADND